MSAIIAKPFNWAKKIVHAVFRGSPNLITAEDLNRQVVALKKEMFLLQQGNRYVNSDFQVFRTLASSVICSGTYVFIEGMKIAVDMAQTLNITWSNYSEYDINLYCTKTLVQFSDDASHEISGAVFASGTAYEAADHYVYENPQIAIVQRPDPNSNFEYPQVNSKEYVCTLCRIHYETAETNMANRWWVNNFCKQPNRSLVHDYEGPTQYRFYVRKNNAVENHVLVPGGNTPLTESLQILWSRLYNLERRLFLETSYNNGYIVAPTVDINGATYDNARSWSGYVYATSIGMGAVLGSISYKFYLVGNLCFLYGTVSRNSTGSEKIVYSVINSDEGKAPSALVGDEKRYVMGIVNQNSLPDVNRVTGATFTYSGEGAIPSNAVQLQMGTPYTPHSNVVMKVTPAFMAFEGVELDSSYDFYVVYPFSSHHFWSAANIDHLGNFDDHK